ncbi:MAG: PHP-associated domain-containing protein, partial [Promethearchaeota archaeon]
KVVQQSYKAKEIADALKKKGILDPDFLTIPGCAEFAPAGTMEFPNKGIELLGLGLPRTFVEDVGGLEKISRMIGEDLTDKIHDVGGLAILPHPFYFEPAGLSKQIWNAVDAIESFNQTVHVFSEPRIKAFMKKIPRDLPLQKEVLSLQVLFAYFSWRNRVELKKRPMPEVGSSDAHVECFVGTGCTWVDQPINDLEDLRQALKKNRTRAMLNPRWEMQASMEEITDMVWNHWGRKIAKMILKINEDRRAIIPIIKLITFILRKIQENGNKRYFNENK